jgi:hypothetical protein
MAKNTISMNKSSKLVDTNAAMPTLTRAKKSKLSICELQVKEATYIDLSFFDIASVTTSYTSSRKVKCDKCGTIVEVGSRNLKKHKEESHSY